MKTEIEAGAIQPKSQEHLEPLEAGRGGKKPPWSLHRERGPADTWASGFWPLEP